MTTFLDTPRFPTGISYGSEGGPEFSTTLQPLRSGKKIKNRNWQYPLANYNVLPGIKKEPQLEDIREYFYVMFGQDGSFRYKDFSDWKSAPLGQSISSSDQVLGTGDGVTADFPLQKTYSKGALSMVRPLYGVLATSLLVESVTPTGAPSPVPASGYTYTPWTSFITFSTGHIPATGHTVRAGFEHDVIVAFATDFFNVRITNKSCQHGLLFNVPTLPLAEERQP